MAYLIFNDLSLPFKSDQDLNSKLFDFLKIVKKALDSKVDAIIFTDEIDLGWFELKVTEDNTMREWLESQDKTFRDYVKSFIQKTKSPLIPDDLIDIKERFDLSEAHLPSDDTTQAKALLACFLLDETALSCLSDSKWETEILQIKINELSDQGEKSYENDIANCSTVDHLNTLLANLESERQESLRHAGELWNNRFEEFPNLCFCGQTEKQLSKLSVSQHVYNQLYNSLKKLNDYCNKSLDYSLQSIIDETNLRISNESDSVKNNQRYKRLRTFEVNNKKEFFGFHIKNFSDALRLYFLPNSGENKIHIGYFGKHLPTKNNRK
ncbi:MAG: hypothetical protein N4A49_12375 [Marinifilaceae bacterium]|jgi:hypothetical protein|nr:hypothetical protein [Marinifilaceae bacterium]